MSIEKAVADQVKASVETTIRVQIAEALSKDPAELVQFVVDQAMKEKPQSYSHETYFGKAVNEMIRKTAQEEFKLWLGENRDLLRKAIRKRMVKEGKGFIDTVADKITDALGSNFYASVSLKVED